MRVLASTNRSIADTSRPLLFRTVMLDSLHRPGEAERITNISDLLARKAGNRWTKVLRIRSHSPFPFTTNDARALTAAFPLFRQLRAVSTVYLSGVIVVSIVRYLLRLPTLKTLELHCMGCWSYRPRPSKNDWPLSQAPFRTLTAKAIYIHGNFPSQYLERKFIFDLITVAKGLALIDVMPPEGMAFLCSPLSQGSNFIPTLRELRVTLSEDTNG